MVITKEVFETIVGSMSLNDNPINFKFGYWTTIANELLSEGKSPELAALRFPLIYMHAAFEEKILDHRSIDINPTFYIITQTGQNYSIDKRFTDIYKPVLYPIYLDFITAIKTSKKFIVDSIEIPHTRTDLFYLQNKTATQNNLLSIVDAIEVKFSSLILHKTNCYYKSV